MREFGSRLLRFKIGKSPSEIDRVVREIVSSSFEHVAFYRRFWGERGADPSSIRSAAELGLLPVVGKADLFEASVQNRIHDRVRPARCVRTSTSGSTGFPVVVHMSRTEAVARRILLYLAWSQVAGLPPLLRVADVGAWVKSTSGVAATRRGVVSVVRVSVALPVQRQLDVIARHRPHVISGHPTALDLLAQELGTASSSIRPRLVATRGEVLTPEARRTIGGAFGAPVGDFYNCEEVGSIARQCPRNPDVLHVNTDSCIVEVVDDEGRTVPPGVEGRVLLTSLIHLTTPVIRYDVRDRGVLLSFEGAACSCGSRAPRMGVLAGREDDFVVLPSGRKVSPRLVGTALIRALEVTAAERGVDRLIRAFRVIQDAPDHLTVEIVPDADREAPFEAILSRTFSELHPDLRCSIRLVDAIQPEPSGKTRKVVQAMHSTPSTMPGSM